jgi:hypothetical protein
MAIGGIRGTGETPSKSYGKWSIDDNYKSRNLPKDGSTQEQAAESARAILALNPSAPDGVYWINLPTAGPTRTYCLMNSSFYGGGWMLTLKATRGTTFNYDANYWTTANTLNPAETNRNDGDAKFNAFNYFQGQDIMATWPDIGSGGSIGGLGNWIWVEAGYPLNINQTKSTLLSLFTYGNRIFIKDSKTFKGWASGVFSSQVDVRFYGFNYVNNPGFGKVRWGFGWNENGGGLYPGGNMDSDDVSGGIGMSSNFGNYSAGDRINCCQDTTGINRTARVELWVR